MSETQNPILVSRFEAPRIRPFSYPGSRPEGPFMVDAQTHFVDPIEVVKTDEGIDFYITVHKEGVPTQRRLDEVLADENAAPMSERIPVVTFGSNANPGQLVDKFKDFGHTSGDRMVPTTSGVLHDATPVFVPKIGIHKYSFADLVPDQGSETQVFINWLTPEQLEHMHTTEKAYTFCQYGTVDIKTDSESLAVPAYVYAGDVNVYLDDSGRPVRVAEVESSSSLPSMTQREFQQTMVDKIFMNDDRIKGTLSGVVAVHAWIDNMPSFEDREGKRLWRSCIGNYMAEVLKRTGNAGEISLKSAIPENYRDIKNPLNLAQILGNSSKTTEDAV